MNSGDPPTAPDARAKERLSVGVLLVLAVVMLVIGLLALLVITPTKPVGDASAVSAAFLGYTNNAVRKRVAVFSINNRSPIAVRRQWYYEVQELTGGTWTHRSLERLPYARRPVFATFVGCLSIMNPVSTKSRQPQ